MMGFDRVSKTGARYRNYPLSQKVKNGRNTRKEGYEKRNKRTRKGYTSNAFKEKNLQLFGRSLEEKYSRIGGGNSNSGSGSGSGSGNGGNAANGVIGLNADVGGVNELTNTIDFAIPSRSQYLWNLLPPRLGFDSKYYTKTKVGKKLQSLKSLCVDHIAWNIAGVDLMALSLIPWSIAKQIWNRVLHNNMDSFDVYLAFANNFAQFSDFHCHKHTWDPKSTTIRDYVIQQIREPKYVKYRVETFLENVSAQHFATTLSRAPGDIVLEITSTRWNREDFFHLFNINNLRCLSLVGTLVDDSFLRGLETSMKMGKLKNLTWLKIRASKVTLEGITRFCKLKAVFDSELVAISVNHRALLTEWRLLDTELAQQLNRTSFGHAYKILRGKLLSYAKVNTSSNGTVKLKTTTGSATGSATGQDISKDNNHLGTDILDVKVVSSQYESAKSIQSSWEQRLLINSGHETRKLDDFVYLRMRRENKSILAKPVANTPTGKKRKQIKTNFKNYFSL